MSTTAIVPSDAIVPEPLVSGRKMKKKKEIFYIDGVENGVSEGKYEEAYKNGYLFGQWNPDHLSEDYYTSCSLPEDIYGALIASFLFFEVGY
jgi:hypothetical protein